MQRRGLEVLYGNSMEFAESMRGQGNEVEVHVEPYARHDSLYLGGTSTTGFDAESIKAAKLAGKYPG